MRPHTNEECYQILLDNYIELESGYKNLKEDYEDLKKENESNKTIIKFLRNENYELYQKTKELGTTLKRREK